MKKTNHLTLSERERIYTMRAEGKSLQEISNLVCRSKSCISKELKRNKAPKTRVLLNGYAKAHYAHEQYKKRKSQPRSKQRLKSAEIRALVSKEIKARRSPRDVVITVRKQLGESISHEAIYQWLYCERRDLIKFLPRKGKRRNRANKRKRYMKPAAKKTPIIMRPTIVSIRERFGDWEGDTIVSRQSKACIFTLTERKSRFTILHKLEACDSQSALMALLGSFYQIPIELLKTLTLDNGSENACHDLIALKTALEVYFCDPYCSWQRGSVENVNGVIRLHFSKKTDFAKVSLAEVKQVQDWLNTRNMDCLGERSPAEVFFEELQKYPNPLQQRFAHLGDIKQSFLLKAA